MSRSGGGDGVGTYTGTIPVCVKGTIKSSQYVTVSVNTPTLTCEDGTTAAVSLSQPKDTWTCDEVSGDGTTANFGVSTELAQPGDWSGTATFGCEMGSNVQLIEFVVEMTTCYAEPDMTWEEWFSSSYCCDVEMDFIYYTKTYALIPRTDGYIYFDYPGTTRPNTLQWLIVNGDSNRSKISVTEKIIENGCYYLYMD